MYNVSVSPHIRDKSNTTKIMLDVCVALLPTIIFGVCYFGVNALIVVLSSVISCVLFEIVYDLIAKKLNNASSIKSIRRNSNYDGTQEIIVTYGCELRAIYTVRN